MQDEQAMNTVKETLYFINWQSLLRIHIFHNGRKDTLLRKNMAITRATSKLNANLS